MFYGLYPKHLYSLVSIGLPKKYSKTFGSRQSANDYMYQLCKKFNLHINEVYDDKHDKTYKCSCGVKFFIQRM